MRPSEALWHAIARAHVIRSSLRKMKPGRPGEIIEGMPEDQRAVLRELTSDNIDAREYDAAMYADQRTEEEKLFDRIRRRS